MHLRIPGPSSLATPGFSAAPAALLCIHATGAWSYAGGDDEEEGWPIVAAFEV